jgi:MSHA pilin protein MshC
MKAQAGYSMLELVVVLVIAAILAALTIPAFTDAQSKATWFHEQLKGGVRYAQRQAVAQRRLIYVDVQPTQVRFCYDAGCTAGNEFTAYRLTAPSGVTVTPTINFYFDGLGRPSVAGTSLSVGGRSVTITAETGYVF